MIRIQFKAFTRKTGRRNSSPEHFIQVEVVDWLKKTYPRALFTASAGGMRTGIRTAMKMKAAGYVSGCPDLLIFEPRGRYHGLAIEMKAEKGRPDSEGKQKRFIDALCDRKYYADFCYGVEHAKQTITAYMNHGEAV